MPHHRHFLAAVFVYVGFTLEAYGTVAGGPFIVSLGAMLVNVGKTIE